MYQASEFISMRQKELVLVRFIALLLISLFAGCASQKSVAPKPSAPEPRSETSEPKDGAKKDTLVQAVADGEALYDDVLFDTSASQSVSQSIEDARIACRESRFADANRLLARAIGLIDADRESPDSVQEANEPRYLEEIASIYADKLPVEYLDSIPEELSVMVFEKRLSRSVDSISVTVADSMAMAKLLCQQGINYDYPMVWNDRVYKSLIFLSQSRKGPMAKWLERSGRFLPFMIRMFADSGLPLDLAFLPLIESGFSPIAYSRARAAGIWQFISSTGKLYGLRNSYWLDERRDPYKSTQAAIKYLRKLYRDFGNWHCAVAAYNCGEGWLRRSLSRADTLDFWRLKLPKETMNYVPQFISALILAKNPQCFGFDPIDTTRLEIDTVYISDCVEMKSIADGIGISPEALHELNPHILHWCTPPDMSNVALYVPKGKKDQFVSYCASIPPESKISWYRYRISRRDNISSISRRFKVPVAAIKSVNNMKSNRLIVGRYLFIPIPAKESSPSTVAVANTPSSIDNTEIPEAQAFREKGMKPIKYKVKAGDTFSDLAQLFKISEDDLCRWNRIASPRPLRKGEILTLYVTFDQNPRENAPVKRPLPESLPSKTYTVIKGDNCSVIAGKLGIAVDDLMAWNGLKENSVLHAGDMLLYCQTGPAAQPAAQTARTAPAQTPDGIINYKVQQGDNLYSLSSLFKVDINELMQLNGLDNASKIKAGQVLRIPDRKNQTDRSDAGRKKVVYYKVKEGDTLWGIAQAFGIPVERISEVNGLDSQGKLRPGDTLRIVTN